MKFLEKLFSRLKHNTIVNFLCKSIGYTLYLTMFVGQQCSKLHLEAVSKILNKRLMGTSKNYDFDISLERK